MQTSDELEDFLRLHAILSSEDEEYPESKEQLDRLAASFKQGLWVILRKFLQADDRIAARNLIWKLRRLMMPINPPLLSRLHELTFDEMAAFERDWIRHVTRADFERRAVEIECLLTNGKVFGARKLIKSLFVALSADYWGRPLLSDAEQRWGYLVSRASLFRELYGSHPSPEIRPETKAERNRRRNKEWEKMCRAEGWPCRGSSS